MGGAESRQGRVLLAGEDPGVLLSTLQHTGRPRAGEPGGQGWSRPAAPQTVLRDPYQWPVASTRVSAEWVEEVLRALG